MLQVKVARYEGKEMVSLTVSKKNNPEINGYLELNLPAKTAKADEESRLFRYLTEKLQRQDIKVEVKDFTTKDFKNYATKQLVDKFNKMSDGVNPGARELIAEVLKERGALPEPKKEEKKQQDKAHRSKSRKPEGAKTGSERDLKKMLSDEEVEAQLKEARSKKGENVKFFCQKTQRMEEGVIITARLDKRSNFIQFRIKITSGSSKGLVYGKGNDSEDLEFIGNKEA